MLPPSRVLRRLREAVRGPGRLTVFHDPRFRLPITSLNARHGLEVRRADFAVWYLTIDGWVHPRDVRAPPLVSYADLARVHTDDLLHSLTAGDGLAEVFQADPAEFRVHEVMTSMRLACGAVLEGARVAMANRRASLCTLGGFHHSFPDKAGGLCPVNDLAVAVAALRADGFDGQIAILDLDAHPPDGTAACLIGDDRTWIGSLSGSDWGPVPGADETVLPTGSGDAVYLEALGALLDRMPRPQLALVIAGGDVLAGDRFGQLGLTLDGVRQRDLAVIQALRGVASVWVPGGGYSRRSWRVLAGTGLALTGRGRKEIPADAQPENLRYDAIARKLDPDRLGDADDWFAPGELERELGMGGPVEARLLDTYTAEGVHYALDAYGVFGHLERLGYRDMAVELDRADVGERVRVLGTDERGEQHLLGEVVLEGREIVGRPVLFVHWLTLRHPAGTFGKARPKLPGQEVPGLGLSLEAIELLERAARRTGAHGVAFEPSYYHTAWASSEKVRFVDDARQGRFEALVRDLGSMPRHELSQALADGRVKMNGDPYGWEPAEMAFWLEGREEDEPDVDAERERVRFTVDPP